VNKPEHHARRVETYRRYRRRRKDGKACYTVEIDAAVFDLLERYGDLPASRMDDRKAVGEALGKLLHRALEALLREQHYPPPLAHGARRPR
jgi:hypothetical protein